MTNVIRSPGGTGIDARGAVRRTDHYPTEFWLHVTPNGAELRFQREPGVPPTVHVWTAKGREYTATYSIECSDDNGRRFVSPVQPPGADWMRFNLVPEFIKPQLRKDRPSQVWSRKAVRS
jgi:hypothetical protein